ncbi:ABC transporter ATP-binding protein [[Eubacterium] cellulosolvens]
MPPISSRQDVNNVTEHLVKTSNLSKCYGDIFAIKDVSIEINKGEIFGLMGPNGAGKSTLIRILSTLTRSSSGKASIFGYDLRKDQHQVKKLIGIVLHHNLLYDELTAKENLSYYLRLYGFRDKETIEKIIFEKTSQFNIAARVDDQIGTLSSGQRKRFDIIRATLHNPKLMLLDEPFSGLDRQGIDQLKIFFYSKKKNSTILFSTHNQQIGEEVSDRIATLEKGRIIETKTSGD